MNSQSINPAPPELSVVVPVHNEEGNIEPLIGEIRAALDGVLDYEVIYVDDGSSDATLQRLIALRNGFNRLRILNHRKSCGQSTAVLTGARAARAAWIVTLDGDGQNDPADIPALLAARSGADGPQLICGRRRRRNDSWLKRLSSRVANRVRAGLLKDNTPDTGCGLKLFSRSAFLALPHFDHMHRFLPALMLRNGGRVVNVDVNHRARGHGKSNYGLHNRLWVGIIDMFGVMWLQRRTKLPVILEK
ncbi:MAG: glycosyltransferase family 2 protein [Gammaproteobacteria bacterium]